MPRKKKKPYVPIGFDPGIGDFKSPIFPGATVEAGFLRVIGAQAKQWWERQTYTYEPNGHVRHVRPRVDAWGERQSYHEAAPGAPTFDYTTANKIKEEIHKGKLSPAECLCKFIDLGQVSREYLESIGAPAKFVRSAGSSKQMLAEDRANIIEELREKGVEVPDDLADDLISNYRSPDEEPEPTKEEKELSLPDF